MQHFAQAFAKTHTIELNGRVFRVVDKIRAVENTLNLSKKDPLSFKITIT